MSFIEISPSELSQNVFDMIGKQWMLVTAGNEQHYNTMTASWGGVGVMWNKNVATTVIRPQRYTFEFIEKSETFTLSFLPEEYREALAICGSKSGRDIDKAKETGLTPVGFEDHVYFEQAEMVFVCRELYKADLTPDGFIDKTIIEQAYPGHDFHRAYIGEIIRVLKKA